MKKIIAVTEEGVIFDDKETITVAEETDLSQIKDKQMNHDREICELKEQLYLLQNQLSGLQGIETRMNKQFQEIMSQMATQIINCCKTEITRELSLFKNAAETVVTQGKENNRMQEEINRKLTDSGKIASFFMEQCQTEAEQQKQLLNQAESKMAKLNELLNTIEGNR